jgi:hypothetical protein
VNDPRAQVFRPIADGTTAGGLKFVDAYLEVFDDWADMIKRKGEQHELTQNCRKVLHRLLTRFTDFKTGICEPCLDTLMAQTRLARATIVRALAMLNKHGFLDWVRRTIRTDLDPGDGPQVKQVSNAYYFDLSRLHKRVLMALRQKMRRKGRPLDEAPPTPRVSIFTRHAASRAATVRGRRDNQAAGLASATSYAEKAALLYPGRPDEQAAWLAMLGAAASSEGSLNPSGSIKG